MSVERHVEGEAAMEALGAALGRVASEGGWIYLHGDLGAGKTTLVRGLLRGLGHTGAVKSPTYTLVEPYELAGRAVYHLDLYRLGDPEELEWIGIREIFAPGHLCLVEWPERGRGVLPEADLLLELEYAGEGRRIRAEGRTARGRGLLGAWLGADAST